MSEQLLQVASQPELPTVPEPRNFRFATLAMAGAVLLGPALGPAAGQEHESTPPAAEATIPAPIQPKLYGLPPDEQLPIGQHSYLPVEDKARQIVLDRLAHPTDGLYKKVRFQEMLEYSKALKSPFFDTANAKWTQANEEDINYKFYSAVADKYGLTMHDGRYELAEMRRLSYNIATPFDAYFTQAHSYLRKFGVNLKLATPADKTLLGDEAGVPTKNGVKKFTAKTAMRQLVDAFVTLPQEYIDYAMGAGQKTIYLGENAYKPTPGKDDEGVYAGLAITVDGHRAFVVNLATSLDVDGIYHEIGHLKDAAEMGDEGAYGDVLYKAINGGVPYRKKDGNKDFGANSFDYAYTIASEEITNLRLAGKFAEACQTAEADQKKMKVLGKKALFMSNYAGQHNAMEDKAEVASNLLDEVRFNDVLDARRPLIRAKALMWLERVAAFRPRLASFLIDSRNKYVTSVTPLVKDCDKPADPHGK